MVMEHLWSWYLHQSVPEIQHRGDHAPTRRRVTSRLCGYARGDTGRIRVKGTQGLYNFYSFLLSCNYLKINSLKSKRNSIPLLSPCPPALLWVICSSQPGHRETYDHQPGQPRGTRFNQ